VVQGLDADIRGRGQSARSFYERALQVDPTNPWPYLTLARLALVDSDPDGALAFVDACEARLSASESLRASAYLAGIRGEALEQLGRSSEALPYRERALEQAPQVWDDGFLDALELW
jgi:tetratricopeptide (TPR) repeat protein